MFCVDRVVDLYVLGATSCAATYMFQKEELAEELFFAGCRRAFHNREGTNIDHFR
jgi:hypothetical protein